MSRVRIQDSFGEVKRLAAEISHYRAEEVAHTLCFLIGEREIPEYDHREGVCILGMAVVLKIIDDGGAEDCFPGSGCEEES